MAEDTIRGNDVATLRRVNTRSILLHLLDRPDHAFTVKELADLTSLSRPTVSSVLHTLVTQGWSIASAADAPPTRAGRPAQHFGFNRDAGVCVGVDAGPHSVSVLIADLSGAEITRTRSEFDDLSDPETAVDAIEATIRGALHSTVAPVVGITVAVPGVVDRSGELQQSVVVPRWANAGLATALGALFPRAMVTLGNDVKLATLAEVHARQDDATSTLLYLSIGRRVSAGLVLSGRLHGGATGSAGELGASPAIAWAHAIDDAMSAEARPLKQIARDAREGEPVAERIMKTIGTSLADGLAILALAIDPEVVIVAGPAAQAGDALAGPLLRGLAEAMTPPPRLEFAIVVSEPSARGAAHQSLNAFRLSGFTRESPETRRPITS